MAETNTNTTTDDNNNSATGDNLNAKKLLQEKDIKMENGQSYATGSGAFASFFNSLVDEVQQKAQKEADKPRYRFLDSLQNKDTNRSGIIYSNEFEKAVSDLQEQLGVLGFEVELFENLDCNDVTKEDRYYIRISSKSGVYINVNLMEYEEKIKEFTFNEQDYWENIIGRINGSITQEVREVAKIVCDYIAHIMYFRELYTLTYRKIGWDVYNCVGWIFKYDTIYSKIPLIRGRASKKYSEGLEVSSNNIEKEYEWVLHTKSLISKHVYDALILAAGISGLIRQLLPYTKENNININIVGKPASGKSTICHYLLSFFGNTELIEGSFTDTANSMEETRVRRPVLPYVLDERMLKIENDSEKAKKQTVLMDIFREYEGKVKERLGKQYEEESGERTYGPIISSSVRSMMDYVFESDDLGQYRRFIEFNIGGKEDGLLFGGDKEEDGSEEAKKTEQLAYANYGFGVRIIVEYMLEVLKEGNNLEEAQVLIDRFNAIDKYVQQELEKRQTEEIRGLTSSSKRFALIILSYQVLRESLLYYDYVKIMAVEDEEISRVNITNEKLVEKRDNILRLKGECDSLESFLDDQSLIPDKSNEITELLIENLVLKMKKVILMQKPKDDGALYDYILKHTNYFIKYDKSSYKAAKYAAKEVCENYRKYLGFYEEKGEQIILYTIDKYCLNHFWYMETIPEPEDIIKYIAKIDEGIVNTSKIKKWEKDDKNTRTNYAVYEGSKDTVDFHKKILNVKKYIAEDKEEDEA